MTHTSAPELDELLKEAVSSGASDLHLSPGSAPYLREAGVLRPFRHGPLSAEDLERYFTHVVGQSELPDSSDVKVVYGIRGCGRFRFNLYRSAEGWGATVRIVPGLKLLEELHLPELFKRLVTSPSGLILVTGTARSGVSTTLASMVDHLNHTYREHILTVEDEIEFLHPHKNSMITQREVGGDSESWMRAMETAKGQDAEVVMLAGVRDVGVLDEAFELAELGCLVLIGMRATSVSDKITSIIDWYPPERRTTIEKKLADHLVAVTHQRLVKRLDEDLLIPAVEVYTGDVCNDLIRQGFFHKIYSAMETGTNRGNCTMEQALLQLVVAGTISREQALQTTSYPEELKTLLEGIP